jgi:predicted dehydrogenase
MGIGKKINILIIGCGSIGKRHISNLAKLGYKNVHALRTVSRGSGKIENEFGIKCFTVAREAFNAKPNITFVCTPTSEHIKYVKKALEKDSHVLVEKPISHSLKGISQIVKLSRKKRKIVHVGYQWRYHPVFIKLREIIKSGKLGKVLSFHISMGNYLPDWHPHEDYRISYAGKKSLGGGVVLTFSHEIDYCQFLFGRAVKVASFLGRESGLEIDTEDTADILLNLKNNISGTIHLDYLQRPVRQSGYIILEKGRIDWDVRKNIILVRHSSNGKIRRISFGDYALNNMYIDEVKDFLRSVNRGKYSCENLKESILSLKTALAAIRASCENSLVSIR